MTNFEVIIVLITICAVNGKFSCRNRQGKSVDWYVGYKLPLETNAPYSGTTLYYAHQDSKEWSPPENLEGIDNAIASTLSQYYSSPSSQIAYYIMYNDEAPGLTRNYSKRYGHAKGVVVFGTSTGFWLIHSVPKFPDVKRYYYPNSGKRYGQSFLCISLKTDSLKMFSAAMKLINPSVYNSKISRGFAARFPFLRNFTSQKYSHKNKSYTKLIQHFRSARGCNFYDYAKNKFFGEDLYLDLIAPQLKTSLLVETWMNGPGDLPSTCNKQYDVKNVKKLNVSGIPFANSHDHSKWAISDQSNKHVVCVSDINRQSSQKKRGGGAVCFENDNVWELLSKSICELQRCPTKLR